MEFFSCRLIYDINLYIYHPTILIYRTRKEKDSQDAKSKEKNIIKLLQTQQVFLLSNQILFIDILELAFLIMYNLMLIPSNDNNKIKEKIESFIIAVKNKIYQEQHFISFYLDIFNSKKFNKNPKKFNMVSSILSNYLEEIPAKYSHWIDKNFYAKDNRLISALSYLVMLKYKSLMIEYNNNVKKDNNNKAILDLIDTNFNILFQKDLFEIYKNYTKNKDNKKAELIFEKEELNNKEYKIIKIYYKLLMNYLSKTKNFNADNFNSFSNEIGCKYMKEIEENFKTEKKQEINVMNSDINLNQKRKDSFHKYFIDEDDFVIINSNITNITSNNNVNNININVNNNNLNENKTEINFMYAKYPILCTKRDLVLKNFGFYFFDEFFKDERFIKMKNYFMKLYPPFNEENNYNNFEKQMIFNYPSILKNFSNCTNYFPRLILRPDLKFFQNKNLYISHNYLKIGEQKDDSNNTIFKQILNEENNKVMHFEYGHGLLKQDNFNLFTVQNTKENISSTVKSIQCEHLNNICVIPGKIRIVKKWIIFQTDNVFDFSSYDRNIKYRLASRKDDLEKREKQIIIPLNLVSQMIYRNFLFYNQALEVFLLNGKSYFFNFYEYDLLDNFVQSLKTEYQCYNIKLPEIINDPISYFHTKNYTNDWLEGKISTVKYLLLINKFSGRTYNDLTQYLIFPWVLNDYSDIKDKKNFRKMQYCMAIQDEAELEKVKMQYEKEKNTEYKSHFSYHYSNNANICLYLLRLNPFTYGQIRLNKNFDSPDRQIESLQDMCYVFKEFKETSELVPEYFFMVECFLNLNFNFFGHKSNKSTKRSLVNNVKLDNVFFSLLEIILFHKNLINSDEVGSNINKWIDNIFGENQITTKKNVINSFPIGCYGKFVKEDINQIIAEIKQSSPNSSDYGEKVNQAIKDIRALTDHAYLFGQCPPQLFQKSHPEKTIKSSDLNDDHEIEVKIVSDKILPIINPLYFYCKEKSDNIFILTKDEIWIFTTALKPLRNIKIKKIQNIFSLYDQDNEKERIMLLNKFIYRNLIFEIEDFKLFFIGGYLDNSFIIYYFNNKNITSKLAVITESRVTCIKKIPSKKGFLTGHLNGKIIKWKYIINKVEDDEDISSLITLKKISSFIAHKSVVQNIEINEELNIMISASIDGIIFVRKLYDFELLNVIRYNNINNCLLDIFFENQIIIATYYNIKEKDDVNKKIKVNTYSVNGIKLGKIKKNIPLPLIIKDSNDKLFIFVNKLFYEVYVTFKEWELLIDMNKGKFKKGENVGIISCGYDSTQKILFCLFENGRLLKISLGEET